MGRRPLPRGLLSGGVAEALFLVRLGVPSIPVFDETHYLPAARALLAGAVGRGDNDFKIALARKAVIRALAQAAAGTPQSQTDKRIA